jgi:hypothetical protein
MEKERNYWIQRISYNAHITYPLLDKGYLCIGWSDFVKFENYVDNVRREGGWNYMESCMLEDWGALTTNRHQLWRYMVNMKVGDWVVVPKAGTFSVYEIEVDSPISIADYKETIYDWYGVEYKRNENGLIINEEGKVVDLGFLRKVKLIRKDISRYKYCDNILTSRLKVRQTNVNIWGIRESVLNAIQNYDDNKPIDLRADIENIIPNICESIQKILSQEKFEMLVNWYFDRVGASNVYIPSKNPSDKESYEDIDVEATFDLLRTTYYVQVKHHKGKTAEWAAMQVAKKKELHERTENADGYTRVYWALTSADDFTDECKKIAQDEKIQLINGKEFASMLIDAGLANVNDAF